MVAGQLGLGGNPSLGRINIVLDSRQFNADVLRATGLLPELCKHEWPRFYEAYWNATQGAWLADSLTPSYEAAGSYVWGELLDKKYVDNGTLRLGVKHPDSLFAWKLLTGYVTHLDTYIRLTIRKEAQENREFLEGQLVGVSDPLLRHKIQELMATEAERMMAVGKSAFRTVDPVFVSKSFGEERLYPPAFAIGLALLAALTVIFGHALAKAHRTQEGHALLVKIRSELLRRPFQRHAAR
jgi:hypothetical protein